MFNPSKDMDVKKIINTFVCGWQDGINQVSLMRDAESATKYSIESIKSGV